MSSHDMQAHLKASEQTYAGFLKLVKYSGITAAVVIAILLFIMS